MNIDLQFKVNSPQQEFLFGLRMVKNERYRIDDKGIQHYDGGVTKLDLGFLFCTFSLLFVYDKI